MTDNGDFKCLDVSKDAEFHELHKGGNILCRVAFLTMLKGKIISFIVKPGNMIQHSISKW